MKNMIYSIHAFLINPIINLFAIYYTNIFERSQTYIGNTLHHPIYLFLWSLSSCFGYYIYSKQIWNQYEIHYNKTLHFCIHAGMILSIFLPCSNDLPGLINDMHIWMAAICVAIFIIEWIYYALHSTLQYEIRYKRLFFLFMLCLFFLMYFGHVTAFCEIVFSILMNIYLYSWIYKKEA